MLSLKKLLSASILLLPLFTNAQEKSPLITGNVNISIKKGTIACDLIVTDLPDVKDYVIRLNSGMNIHYFKDLKRSKQPLYYDMDTKDSIQSDETKAYYLHENTGNPARYLPEELEIKYAGMYPVIADSLSGYMGQDWRGNIAFNGYSVRAEGMQAAWYPVLYDKATRTRYAEVKYNINITCNDCSLLFLNGSQPVRGKKGSFKSDATQEMSMYCGDVKAKQNKGVWLINSDMTGQQEQKLFDLAGSYQSYYTNSFNIPFKGSLAFVQTTPVADPMQWAFSFFSAPTTFNVGAGQYGLHTMFDDKNSGMPKKTMAHELAHYYFGTLLKPGNEFGHAIEEGFAEYLAFNLTKHLEGEAVYNENLQNKVRSLKYLYKYQPFSKVVSDKDYGNREYYLYYYTPVLLLAIEKEMGEPVMWKWLKAMIANGSDHADYSLMLNTFRTAVTDKDLQEKIINKYFTSDDALKNAYEVLGVKE